MRMLYQIIFMFVNLVLRYRFFERAMGDSTVQKRVTTPNPFKVQVIKET